MFDDVLNTPLTSYNVEMKLVSKFILSVNMSNILFHGYTLSRKCNYLSVQGFK